MKVFLRPRVRLFFWLALVAGFTVRAEPNAATLYQQTNAAMCAGCHGTQGHAVNGSTLPSLAGMSQSDMVRQLTAFRDGRQTATVMHQIARGLSEAQMESIAAYYAAIQP